MESAPGNGATFEIFLPQAIETAEEAVAGKPALPPRGSGTILVVEDESEVRELAREFLQLSGYTVLEAQSGVEAPEVISRHSGPVHLVVSDMVMPRMGGAELAEKLRAIRPGVKVVLMSGYTDYSNGNPGPGVNQAAMLPKPFSQTSLVEAVREALEGKRSDSGAPQALTR